MSDRAFVATRKGLFEMQRDRSGWRISHVSFLGDPVSMMLTDPRDRTLYAALNLGHFGVKLHRSENGGRDWLELEPPSYPTQPDGAKDDVPWRLQMIWELAAGGHREDGVIWAGTLPGGMFRSTDRGASWQLVTSLWKMPERKQWSGGGYDVPGIHSVCVDPRDPRHVIVGVSIGGVWSTHDGGTSWKVTAKGMRAAYMPPEQADNEIAQDPHRVVMCGGSPDTLWCQHHNGIFRSTDGSKTWQEIEHVPVSSFGFAVAVHPADPKTAWFVPAVKDEKRIPANGALCVTRTRDGGRTFEVLRSGLPQYHCYDLIYRHSLAVSSDGRRLMMGSTTGGLWCSDDAGEHWTNVSSTMPPIYAVRFA